MSRTNQQHGGETRTNLQHGGENDDKLSPEEIQDIKDMLKLYKDASTAEDVVEISKKFIQDNPIPEFSIEEINNKLIEGKLGNSNSNNEDLRRRFREENYARNSSVLKKHPLKLKVEGGYKNKTMYKRMKSRRTTRRKSRKY
jgi:hypothetical protein